VAHGNPGPDDDWWSLPVVAETWDGWLNDINGFHVKPEHVFTRSTARTAARSRKAASAAAPA
jgi:L-aminopeptidase/D-esterase-like protein